MSDGGGYLSAVRRSLDKKAPGSVRMGGPPIGAEKKAKAFHKVKKSK
jgi:hypothetical protein